MKKLFRTLSSLDDIVTIGGCQAPGYFSVKLQTKEVILGGSLVNVSDYLDERFIRISRTLIVNRNHVVSFDESRINLSSGESVMPSRRRVKVVLESLLGK